MDNIIDVEAIDTKESSNEKQVLSNMPDTINQTISRNKKQLNKVLRASEDELKHLAIIQDNMDLANQKKQEIISNNYQNDIENTAYKNYIISIHNRCLEYAFQRGIQFWKSYDNSSIYYRVNKFTKRKIFNTDKSFYSLIGTHIEVYDTIEKVQFFNNNSLILIADYLSIIKSDIFNPHDNIEWLIFNNMKYKNTFQYTSFLQKRILSRRKQQLEQQLQLQYNQPPQYAPQVINTPQPIQLLNPLESVQHNAIFTFPNPQEEIHNISQQLKTQPSIILNFIDYLIENKYSNYIMTWLANFFQTLNKSCMALVLIGDKETTDTLINNIIRPIFASKKEYFSLINDETLKKTDEIIIRDKIFYHIDELSVSNLDDKRTGRLVRELLKTNTIGIVQAVENNETYIHGEIVITSSNNSPYSFLKDIYSRCSVFKVKHLEKIMKKLNVLDRFDFEEKIKNDLNNFSNILAQYPVNQNYQNVINTPEQYALPTMKNGVLRTLELDTQIEQFIQKIKTKSLSSNLRNTMREDPDFFNELKHNFNENMIAQPLLSTYFNLLHDDIVFAENSYFIEILKEKSEMFNKAPDDKSKYNSKKRYKIF